MRGGAENLAWLRSRRSLRRFTGEPVGRAMLERLVEAATTAPSSSNRQPWRFAVVTDPEVRAAIAAAVKERTAAIEGAIAKGPHAEEFAGYGDFFWEPLAEAAAVVVPQYRAHPDLLAGFLRSAGADPESFSLPGAMQPELCATSAAVMAMLLQAHAEGLGAVWMAGPMVARGQIEELLEITSPWRVLGAVALGHPAEKPTSRPRKPFDRVVKWI